MKRSVGRVPAFLLASGAALFKKLDLPTYWAGINPQLKADFSPDGRATHVTLRYPRDAIRQYLSYASLFDPGLSALIQP